MTARRRQGAVAAFPPVQEKERREKGMLDTFAQTAKYRRKEDEMAWREKRKVLWQFALI
jgi:hypothetical protein